VQVGEDSGGDENLGEKWAISHRIRQSRLPANMGQKLALKEGSVEAKYLRVLAERGMAVKGK
jgi:hypothetical protein